MRNGKTVSTLGNDLCAMNAMALFMGDFNVDFNNTALTAKYPTVTHALQQQRLLDLGAMYCPAPTCITYAAATRLDAFLSTPPLLPNIQSVTVVPSMSFFCHTMPFNLF